MPKIEPPSPSSASPIYIVGVGASAGGLDAIKSFFKNVHPGDGVAFVVVQHLSPDYKSLMVELLEKITKLPVQRAEEGMTVKADNIYLIPPKKNLKIFHGALLLEDQKRSNQVINLPIDIFFASLAEDMGSKSIGIILSGAGSDGTRGCRAIKEAGGMVMVQDESSAQFDAMPRSVANAGLPDFILPPHEMASQLSGFINHPYARRDGTATTPVVEDRTATTRIFALLREKSKIDFTFYKPSTINRRIERRITVTQVDGLDEYASYLEINPAEQTILCREMLIGVTNFFRDPDVFNMLEENWLPKKLQDHDGEDFRIWIAGCSTGEEAYSYAMLCSEIMERHKITKNVKIFATDVDMDAITMGGAGAYSTSIAADIPTDLLNKYFIQEGDEFKVTRHIREMVVFAKHNLIKDPPFTNIELVSCRNLLIYFQPILQMKVLENMNFALRTKGLLVLGSSESLGDASNFFEVLDSKCNIFQSHGHRKPMLTPDRFALKNLFNSPVSSPDHPPTKTRQIQEEERLLGRFAEALADDLVPFAMIVDEQKQLQYVVGDGANYLNPPKGKVVQDIGKIVHRDLTIPISTGLTKVFASKTELSFTNVPISAHEKPRKKVDIRIKPLPQQRGKPDLCAVFINETAPAQMISVAPNDDDGDDVETYDLGHEAQLRIKDLEQELQLTRENLQASAEEMETSNEELQATNEELLSSNEELQSTNEELQSVNEELFSVNAEYQSKIAELVELNNDLDNFVNSTAVISIFLDENLDIRRFTASAASVFNIREHDIERPFAHISHRFGKLDLLDLVEKTNQTGNPYRAEIQADDGLWYQLLLRPYMVSDYTQSGLVIVLNDINELKILQNNLAETMRRYDMAQTAGSIGVWEWDMVEDHILWSDIIEPMFGMNLGDFDNSFDGFLILVHPDDQDKLHKAITSSLETKDDFSAEYRVIRSDDQSAIWVHATGRAEYDADGKAIKMVGLVREITKRKKAEINLQKALKRVHTNNILLEEIVSFAPTGLGIANNFIIDWISTAIEKITGYNSKDLHGRHLKDLFSDPDDFKKIEAFYNSSVLSRDDNNLAATCKKKNGEGVEVVFTSRLLNDADNKVSIVFSISELDTAPVFSSR